MLRFWHNKKNRFWVNFWGFGSVRAINIHEHRSKNSPSSIQQLSYSAPLFEGLILMFISEGLIIFLLVVAARHICRFSISIIYFSSTTAENCPLPVRYHIRKVLCITGFAIHKANFPYGTNNERAKNLEMKLIGDCCGCKNRLLYRTQKYFNSDSKFY